MLRYESISHEKKIFFQGGVFTYEEAYERHQCPQNQENPIFWKSFGQSVDQSVIHEKDGKS
jgi:hypothetical protein